MAELETDYIAPRRMFGDDILAQNTQSNQDKALSKFMLDINPKIEVGCAPDKDKARERTEKDVEHPDIGTHVTDYRWIQLDENRRMLQAYERNVIANYNAKEDHYQWYSQTVGKQNVEEKQMDDGCYYYLTDKPNDKGDYKTYEKVPGRKCGK